MLLRLRFFCSGASPPISALLFMVAVSLAGCGPSAPAPSNANPFGDAAAGDPNAPVRAPIARAEVSAQASEDRDSASAQAQAPPPSANGSGPASQAGPDAADRPTFPPEATASKSWPKGGPPDGQYGPPPGVSIPPFAMGGIPNPFGQGADGGFGSTGPARSVDWSQFRGPGGSGISPYANLPATWSDDQNVAWKVDLPGRGSSSPIVVGDRVIVTYYAAYGTESGTGNPRDLQRWIACFDRHTGQKLWEYMAPRTPRLTTYRGAYITEHGYASGTPVSDGQRVYAQFGTVGIVSVGLDGKSPAVVSIGRNTHKWGSGSSPILFQGLLISNASVESGTLGAVLKGSGGVAWTVSGIQESWATPTLVEIPGGRPEVVLSMKGKILAVDARTGKELWRCDGFDDYIVPSVVAADGVVYALGGRSGKSMAVRAGGRGDVTRTHVLWRSNEGSNVPSSVVHDGHLYWVSEDGTAYCLDKQTGEVVTRRRVETGQVYASPLLAGDKLYVVSRRNGTFVFEADPQMELVARNQFSSDDSFFNASPAVADGQIFLRSDRALYCIQE